MHSSFLLRIIISYNHGFNFSWHVKIRESFFGIHLHIQNLLFLQKNDILTIEPNSIIIETLRGFSLHDKNCIRSKIILSYQVNNFAST